MLWAMTYESWLAISALSSAAASGVLLFVIFKY
jgi:hypothetical protein